MFDLSPEHLRFAVVQMVVLILSIAVHEFGHAFVADRLGDSLPRHQGRVTLNPIAHIDPIGTLAMPLLGILIMGGIGFGWGKPVMVNPMSFTRKLRMKTAHLLVAAAGPFMNLVFGVFLAGVTAILVSAGVINPIDHTALLYGVYNAILLNFVLLFFNLVPAPPLDGGTVLAGLLPDSARPAYEQYAQYGMFVAMAVIMIPKLSLIFRWPAEQLFFKVVGPLMSLPGFS